jgi:hypothetical protein
MTTHHQHHHTSVVQRQRGARRSQRLMRRVLPFVASLFLATPLAGPVARSLANAHHEPAHKVVLVAPLSRLESTARDLYTSLGAEVFEKALTGYLNLKQAGRISEHQRRLTVIDFDLPSTEKRLWVLDLNDHKILFHTLVAHGHNSGENEATTFSNTDQSNMSSLGFYVTGQEYQGKHGRSLRLKGLDEGFNTNAASRSVVMHGADYVSEAFIKQNGRLGRSLGCPALPLDQYAQIIDAVHGGSCLFLNKSNAGYASKYLDEAAALAALAAEATSAS